MQSMLTVTNIFTVASMPYACLVNIKAINVCAHVWKRTLQVALDHPPLNPVINLPVNMRPKNIVGDGKNQLTPIMLQPTANITAPSTMDNTGPSILMRRELEIPPIAPPIKTEGPCNQALI